MMVIMVIIMAIYVTTLLTQPISALTRIAERIAEGDLTAQAMVHSQDEIGRLAITFNKIRHFLLTKCYIGDQFGHKL